MQQDSSQEFFSGSLEHIFSELQRIELLIHALVERVRAAGQAENAFRGLCISEEEVDSMLAKPRREEDSPNDFVGLGGACQQLRAEIDQRKRQSAARGINLRLDNLARVFELTPFDVDVILLALAPELDLRYERLYAYLQDDITKKRLSVDLALNLLCSSFLEKLEARRHFASGAPLLRHGLVSLFEDSAQQRSPLLNKYLKIDDRVASHLLDSDELDSRLSSHARLLRTQSKLEELFLPPHIRESLEKMLISPEASRGDLVFYFQGPEGIGKQATAEAICARLKIGLLRVDGRRLAGRGAEEFDEALRLIDHEALFNNAAIYWDGVDALLADAKQAQQDAFFALVSGSRSIAFLGGEVHWAPRDAIAGKGFIHVEFPMPSHADRVQFWKREFDGDINAGTDADRDLPALSYKFSFTYGQMRNAAVTAKNIARWRDPQSRRVSAADIYAACRLQSSRNRSALAQKVVPRYRWGDIVLPADQLRQLREIADTARYRYVVYDDWGFGKRLSLGKGLNILFTGPSGTGKTMAADVIAQDLQIHVYKIDLSQVVSKYIGETEKNLNQIFQEARADNSILFFDEADALFGKRSEVKDAHDRYANIEIGYLLQKLEEHDGVVMLATNLRNNIDEAFVRRMYAVVEFPFPDEEHRAKIWQGLFPREVPWEEPVDFRFLARQFKLTGGHIKNIGLCAAFLAAAEGRGVGMRHLILAAKREHQKLGWPCTAADFGQYYEWIKDHG